MNSLLKLFLLTVLFIGAASCDSKKKSSKKDSGVEKDYFKESPATETLDTLQNELNRGETKLLKKFAVDPIPWQKWDSSVLEKARVRQAPIFLYIISGLSESSRSIAIELSERNSLRKTLMDQSVCAVADIQVNPELGILAHYLCSEINQPTAFPTLVWMSHEGSPIAWLPDPQSTGRNLEIIVKSSAAMVEDIWNIDSRYAVTNSKMDNERRQKRFDAPAFKKVDQSREEIFRTGTRSVSALYSVIDKNIDHTGGLLPTSSLELLGLGSLSTKLPSQVRKKCSLALTEVSTQIVTESLKDHLDGSFFYARRNLDWSVPIFSKNLETQANLARCLLNSGTITGRPALIAEGKQLLDVIQQNWLAKPQALLAPLSNPDREGSFILDLDTLKKVLDEEEIPLAMQTFAITAEGNIPDTVDPLGIFYQKNTLRRRTPLAEIAKEHDLSEEATKQKLSIIREKLLAHRHKVTDFLSEPLIRAGSFARVIRAQVSGAIALNDEATLKKALENAALLRKNYLHSSDGLSLFPVDSCHRPARSKDYSLCALASLDLYQTTLDPQWLTWSAALMDEALQKLTREGHPLREIPESEAIIPLAIQNRSMIFSDSSIGVSHHILHQLAALTGKESYLKMANLIAEDLSGQALAAPVNHTDFLISCSRGDTPLVAVLSDNESPAGKTLLKTLNSPKFLPFINIRGGNGPDLLKNLAELPPHSENATVALFRGDKLLGTAGNTADLEALLTGKISEKE